MRRRALLATLVFLILLFGGSFFLLRFSQTAPPRLSGTLRRGTLRVGERERSFAYYAPSPLPLHPPLLIALHGSQETGEAFRRHTGYGFDRVADAAGFVVVYPDGYQGHWNGCWKSASDSARRLHVDDVGFVRALVDSLRAKLGVDAGRVFATGHSNGGQMAYRLALEMPGEVRAVAAIGASLPVDADLGCQPSGKPVSVLVMNGTDDPITPYGGGTVSLFGFARRGDVRSSLDTALYFAALDGLSPSPVDETLPGGEASLFVERQRWGSPAAHEVVLVTIHGGGHVVPQSVSRYPRILGRTASTFDGPAEIWHFFEQQPL